MAGVRVHSSSFKKLMSFTISFSWCSSFNQKLYIIDYVLRSKFYLKHKIIMIERVTGPVFFLFPRLPAGDHHRGVTSRPSSTEGTSQKCVDETILSRTLITMIRRTVLRAASILPNLNMHY